MSNILDLYQKQVETDKRCQDYETEGIEKMSQEEFEEYKKQVDELREQMEAPIYTEGSKIVNRSYSYDEIGGEKPQMPNANKWASEPNETQDKTYTEEEIKREDLPLFHGVNGMDGYMRKAYCPHCGGELEGLSAPLYNPFTLEGVAFNICKDCGAKITLKNSYPRFVVKDINNNELNIHF